MLPIFQETAHCTTNTSDQNDWSWLLNGADNKTISNPVAQEQISFDQIIAKVPSLLPSEKQKLLTTLFAETKTTPLPSSNDAAVDAYLKKLEICLDNFFQVVKNSSTLNQLKGTDLQKQLNDYLTSRLVSIVSLVS